MCLKIISLWPGKIDCHKHHSLLRCINTSIFSISLLVSYLSARFDALHKAQENNDPREKKSEWQVVLEPAEVARLAKAVGDVQDVFLPKLHKLRMIFFTYFPKSRYSTACQL